MRGTVYSNDLDKKDHNPICQYQYSLCTRVLEYWSPGPFLRRLWNISSYPRVCSRRFFQPVSNSSDLFSPALAVFESGFVHVTGRETDAVTTGETGGRGIRSGRFGVALGEHANGASPRSGIRTMSTISLPLYGSKSGASSVGDAFAILRSSERVPG